MPLGPLPSLGPFGRVVDVRVYPHGFTTLQTDDAGPAGSAIVRPNIEDAAWHAATGQKWGGNILWTGSTPRHTVAYNGPRGRWWGATKVQSGPTTVVRPYLPWFAYNGARIDAPEFCNVLGAAVRVYDDLPTVQTYTGTGNGTLTVDSPATAAGALTGDYEIRCIGTAPDRFLITGPDAVAIGVATAGVPFDGPVRFEITPGLEPFVVGDTFTLTVEEAEQFIILTLTPGGFVSGPDATANDEIWRRPVSLAKPWRLLASLPPASGETFPVPMPWFINASADRAVTVRRLGDNTIINPLRSLDLDLDTGVVTRTDEAVAPFAGTASRTWASETNFAESRSFPAATRTARVFLDFDGDSLIEGLLEMSYSYSMSMSTTPDPDGPFTITTGSGSLSQQSDLVIQRSGSEAWRRTVWAHSFTATMDNGVTSSGAAGYVHNPVHSLAIMDGGVLAVLVSEGEWAYTGTADPYSVAETVRIHHLGTVIAERIGGGSYYERSTPTSIPIGFNNANPRAAFPYSEGEANDSYSGVPITAGEGPGIGVGGGALRDMFGNPIAYTAGGLGYVNNRLPATIGGTWAADSRGNYLSVVEIPTLSGGAQPNPLYPFSDQATLYSDNVPVIAGTGSGTYTDATGGPDSLTPATVATLTAHPGDDRWNIGVF